MSKEIVLTEANWESEVINAKSLVIVDFWAPWCGPCRMVAPVIDEIADETDDVIVGKLNTDEQPSIASRYGIMSIPTVMFFKGGKVVDQVIGAAPKESYVEKIKLLQ
ncbi:MAG TPA: thioredoxin [Deltaproteobacteria bacterium]|nr:MAG: thioredoxin [bacterium]HDH10426.1 thioredoxin [Deltaproteobacteria bacterium]